MFSVYVHTLFYMWLISERVRHNTQWAVLIESVKRYIHCIHCEIQINELYSVFRVRSQHKLHFLTSWNFCSIPILFQNAEYMWMKARQCNSTRGTEISQLKYPGLSPYYVIIFLGNVEKGNEWLWSVNLWIMCKIKV